MHYANKQIALYMCLYVNQDHSQSLFDTNSKQLAL